MRVLNGGQFDSAIAKLDKRIWPKELNGARPFTDEVIGNIKNRTVLSYGLEWMGLWNTDMESGGCGVRARKETGYRLAD